MTTINIAGLTPVEDPSYRYKMPRIVGKVEGRGNGIKTVLSNVTDVGLALNREAGEITKFFGCELGSQTSFANDRAIVNGAHRDPDLQSNLSRYIENFVLCKNCKLPETHYKIKDGLIYQKCLACGSKEVVDMNHKLTAYILAQHKKNKASQKASGEKKKDKKDKKDKKEKKEKSLDDVNENGECEKKDKKDEDSAEKKKTKKKHSSTKLSEDGVGENVFGITDKNELDEDDEELSDSKAADEGMERFNIWMTSFNTEDQNPSSSQIIDELRNIQTMASLKPSDRIIIYLGATFNENVLKEKLIEKNNEILKALAASSIQQRHLISGFEWFCGTKYSSLMKYFPVLLKELLDEEIIEEDVFLEWYADLARNEFSASDSMITIEILEQLKAFAAPFIKWLQEAEEEDEEEEEDDDDDDEESDD